METGLPGRTVVITGGHANIGRGITLAFAAERANVVIVGRDAEQGKRVCEEAIELGAASAFWYAADVIDRRQVQAMVAAVHDRHGGVEVLVNNVGGNVDVEAFVDSDPTTWQRDIDLNLTSMLNCTHAVLPHMIGKSWGRIVNIGSTAGLVGDAMLAVYSATKGAVHAFTRVLAKEVGKHSITVNAIAPYGTLPEDAAEETSRGSRFHPEGLYARLATTKPETLAAMSRPTVLDRTFARPDEIGSAAVYLASDAAAFVTAEVLCVGGGTLVA